MNSDPSKLLIVSAAALGWDLVQSHAPEDLRASFRPLQPVFPAVTCTAQASFRTAALPVQHGMVSNGLYFRDLRKPMFWEQSSALVQGGRIWDGFRREGGTVGLMFWQQSLGEEVDWVLSPRPIHKHSGGMIQDCHSQPEDLYARLSAQAGRGFNLMHYWGPLASARSSEWIVGATERALADPACPDHLYVYLPHLDYDLQRHGTRHPRSARAAATFFAYLRRLLSAAESAGRAFLVFGDYAIADVTGGAVLPNLALRDAGLFRTRSIRGMAYPDFFTSPAFAMVDHEVAHVYCRRGAVDAARAALEKLPGIERVLDRTVQQPLGIAHANSGELVCVAAEGHWFAYPWWTDRREAPDYATHIDIHNKPGFDPCELFFGRTPFAVSLDTDKVRGSHGRVGPGREVAYLSTIDLGAEPASLIDLAARLRR